MENQIDLVDSLLERIGPQRCIVAYIPTENGYFIFGPSAWNGLFDILNEPDGIKAGEDIERNGIVGRIKPGCEMPPPLPEPTGLKVASDRPGMKEKTAADFRAKIQAVAHPTHAEIRRLKAREKELRFLKKENLERLHGLCSDCGKNYSECVCFQSYRRKDDPPVFLSFGLIECWHLRRPRRRQP